MFACRTILSRHTSPAERVVQLVTVKVDRLSERHQAIVLDETSLKDDITARQTQTMHEHRFECCVENDATHTVPDRAYDNMSLISSFVIMLAWKNTYGRSSISKVSV